MSGIVGVPGGKDLSPQLSWSGAPEGTKSYAVTYSPRSPEEAAVVGQLLDAAVGYATGASEITAD
ncbi:hypothetical protein H8R17_44240 [Streptomyces sp. TRM68367]|nr:hypothetical protein [Streptomyces sp. TRM68367]